MHNQKYDVIIIGGGFYGATLALFFRKYFDSILIIEKGTELLQRASYVNQARVHNGYHYPRSFITALRSRVNFPQFTADFREAIHGEFQKVYAIARNNSKVNAQQFKQFCRHINADVAMADDQLKNLFNRQLIEAVFIAKEVAFDAVILRTMLVDKLKKADIEICYGTTVQAVEQRGDRVAVLLDTGTEIQADQSINCTYSHINTLLHNSGLPLLPLKHEITELALIQVPEPLQLYGITVMDGPFFSVMPFPAEHLHSFSHVRYTPHESWIDQTLPQPRDAYDYLNHIAKNSNFPMMLKDAQRYIPVLSKAVYQKSLFEVKTVLVQNEGDDGRPILFRPNYGLKNFSVIMGGKIDNIYDVITALTPLQKRT